MLTETERTNWRQTLRALAGAEAPLRLEPGLAPNRAELVELAAAVDAELDWQGTEDAALWLIRVRRRSDA
jgi:hypothetical protein